MTVMLALLQSTGLVFLFHSGQNNSPGGLPAGRSRRRNVALIVLTLTAGTALIMWLGELITQRGIGNGMSILIFTSVISRLPSEGRRSCTRRGRRKFYFFLLLGVGDHRRGRVHGTGPAPDPRAVRQARRRAASRRWVAATYIPLKVNQAGRHPDHLRVVGPVLPGAARASVYHGQWFQDFVNNYVHEPDEPRLHADLRRR